MLWCIIPAVVLSDSCVHSLFGAITIRVGYGIDVDKSDVDYLGIAHSAMAIFSLAFVPGKYLAESFPILRFLPSFFPGAQFKRDAAEWYPIVRRMCDVPWQAALTAIREGCCMPSMATGLTERMAHLEGEARAEEEESSKNAIASAYAGMCNIPSMTRFTVLIYTQVVQIR